MSNALREVLDHRADSALMTDPQTVLAVLQCTTICQEECHQAGDAGDGGGGDAATDASQAAGDGGGDASR